MCRPIPITLRKTWGSGRLQTSAGIQCLQKQPQISLAAQPKLGKGAAHVRFHGFARNAQLICDFMIGFPQSCQTGHFSFPGGEDLERSLGPYPIRLMVQTSSQQLGRQDLRSPSAREGSQT